ncbi:glycosyltransferase family 2 protein [Aerococcus viridans]|uniref:glycosyltransferase family 2 protein n=1 Tax=Aerococcus viridans TaxID=1377 RepID=UPI003AA89843
MNRLVSIIVPIYNKEKELARCVESIINQTYENIEIILVNDGSNDKTEAVCEDLKLRDSRIKIFHKSNGGVSTARNLGIEKSRGDYLMFIDPDDWVSDNIVKRLLEELEELGSDIVSCCPMVYVNSKAIKNSYFKESINVLDKDRVIAQLYSNDHYKDANSYIDFGVCWGKIYRKDFLIQNKLMFNPALRRMQDHIFNLYAITYANKISYIDEGLYHYNFENMTNASRKVIDDAEVVFTRNAVEHVKFHNQYYKNNELFNTLLKKRLSLLLINILTNKLFNPKYKTSLQNRISQAKELCETKPFNMVFKDSKVYDSSIKSKIVLKFLKIERYAFTYFIYYVAFKLNL